MEGASHLHALLASALESERKDPRAAHELFSRFWKRSDDVRPVILIVSIVAPMLTAAASFYAAASVRWISGEMAVLLHFLGGYYVPVLVAFRQAARRRQMLERITPGQRIGVPLGVAAFLFFLEPLSFLFAVVLSTLAFGVPAFVLVALGSYVVTGSPFPHENVAEGVAFLSLAVGVLIPLSEVAPATLVFRPRAGVPEMFAGLLRGFESHVNTIAAIAVGAVLAGTGPMGLLYDELPVAVAASGVAGLFLGLSLYRQPDHEELGLVAWLGLSRTEVVLGRRATARWRLRLLDTFFGKQPDIVGWLAAAILRLADPDPRQRRDASLQRLLDKADERAAEAENHRREWLASVAATRLLYGGGDASA